MPEVYKDFRCYKNIKSAEELEYLVQTTVYQFLKSALQILEPDNRSEQTYKAELSSGRCSCFNKFFDSVNYLCASIRLSACCPVCYSTQLFLFHIESNISFNCFMLECLLIQLHKAELTLLTHTIIRNEISHLLTLTQLIYTHTHTHTHNGLKMYYKN